MSIHAIYSMRGLCLLVISKKGPDFHQCINRMGELRVLELLDMLMSFLIYQGSHVSSIAAATLSSAFDNNSHRFKTARVAGHVDEPSDISGLLCSFLSSCNTFKYLDNFFHQWSGFR